MPTTPKAPGERRRRSSTQPEWKQLEDGGGRKAPALPRRAGGWLTSTKSWWQTIWASPMAAMWLESDLHGLYRLATLRDAVMRDPDQPSLHNTITQLEDRFGLSPKSRRMLQWEITRGKEKSSEGGAPSPTPIRERRLRAVG